MKILTLFIAATVTLFATQGLQAQTNTFPKTGAAAEELTVKVTVDFEKTAGLELLATLAYTTPDAEL